MAEQFQLRAKKPDYGVSLDDLGFLALKFRRLFGDEWAQSSELFLTVQRSCFHARKRSRFAPKTPVLRADFAAK
ncbi:hypothetical protein RvVAT039_pl10280 (plasmid) [Agrobacterium vitis]|nr:hypothetical protein RvVAT039_pl10280 [Agrobacterium vitis]